MYKYKSNNYFNNLLVACLIKLSVAKVSDEVNPIYSLNVFNLYLDISATSRKSFEFVYGNLLGPAICHIQRIRANLDRHPFILWDDSII